MGIQEKIKVATELFYGFYQRENKEEIRISEKDLSETGLFEANFWLAVCPALQKTGILIGYPPGNPPMRVPIGNDFYYSFFVNGKKLEQIKYQDQNNNLNSGKTKIIISQANGVYRLRDGEKFTYRMRGSTFEFIKLLYNSLQNGHPSKFLVKALEKNTSYLTNTKDRINKLCKQKLRISNDFIIPARVGYRLNTDNFEIESTD